MSPKSFGTLFARLGERAGMAFPIHPHMLRHARRVRNMGAAYSRRRALPTFNKPRARDTHS
jgi:site-specific recombinase XerC